MYFSCILVCSLLHLFLVTVHVCIYLFSDMTYNVNSEILKFSGKIFGFHQQTLQTEVTPCMECHSGLHQSLVEGTD